MKALVIEDRTSMSQLFCGMLEKYGMETKVSATVSEALEDMQTYRPQFVVLDSSVDDNHGLDFLTAVTPKEENETRKGRKQKLESGPGILVVRTIYDVVPTDCPFVKSVLVRPFSTEEFLNSVKQAVKKEDKAEVPKLYKETSVFNPNAELVRNGVSFGESYVFFEEKPIVIDQIMQLFANGGYDMFILTHLRAKVAREKFGLDSGAEVFTLSGSSYPLGTMVESVKGFISERKHPLVAIGDLDIIIEHCGVDMTLRAIQQILSFKKLKDMHEFTLLISVDDTLLTDNVKKLLTEMMTKYKTKEE